PRPQARVEQAHWRGRVRHRAGAAAPGARARRPLLLLLRLPQGALPGPGLAAQRAPGGPAPPRAHAELRLEPPGMAAGGPHRGRAPGPRALPAPAAPPDTPGAPDRDHPRPVLPQAPGHDG